MSKYCSETRTHTIIPPPLFRAIWLILPPLPFCLHFGKMIWSRNSNSTVKAFPLNYLAMWPFYSWKVYLWTVLKAQYRAAMSGVYLCSGSHCWSSWYLSLCLLFRALWKGRAYLDVCHPGNGSSIVCLSTLFRTPIKIHSKGNVGVTMTLNAMTLFPITLSCPIVQNSPRGLTASLGGTKWERNRCLSSLHCLCPGWITETRCCT